MNHIWRENCDLLIKLRVDYRSVRFCLICENCALIKIGWNYNQVEYKISGDVNVMIDDGHEFEPSCAEIIMDAVIK